jgi:hypothetical protein
MTGLASALQILFGSLLYSTTMPTSTMPAGSFAYMWDCNWVAESVQPDSSSSSSISQSKFNSALEYFPRNEHNVILLTQRPKLQTKIRIASVTSKMELNKNCYGHLACTLDRSEVLQGPRVRCCPLQVLKGERSV